MTDCDHDVIVVECDLVDGCARTGRTFRRSRCWHPAEAVNGALEAAARAKVDVEGMLAWRDFMVSNFPDAGGAKSMTDTGSRATAIAS